MDQIDQWFNKSKLNKQLAQVNSFWQGEGRFLVTVNSEYQMYRQCNSEEELISKAILNIEDQSRQPGINFPVLYADFGTVSSPKHWGGKAFLDSTGQRFNIKPVAKNVSAALEIDVIPVNHPDMDGPKAIKIYKRLCEKLGTNDIWLRMPDPQGPFTIAGLVVNQEELLMELYTNPDGVHELLNKTSDQYIDFVKYCQNESNGKMFGSVWPYTYFTPQNGVTIIEDMMPLLSADIYAKYAIPYLKKVSNQLGGLHIHCCGQWKQHAEVFANSDIKIMSIEAHYPFTKAEELQCLADKNVVLIPFIYLEHQDKFNSVSDYYEYLIENTNDDFRYWFIFPGVTEEAIDFAKKYGF